MSKRKVRIIKRNQIERKTDPYPNSAKRYSRVYRSSDEEKDIQEGCIPLENLPLHFSPWEKYNGVYCKLIGAYSPNIV